MNQTFEILLKWVETRDWQVALEEVVPKRKFNDKGRRSKTSDEPACGESEEAQVVVDAGTLEEEDAEEGDDDSADIDTVGGDMDTLAATPPNSSNSTQNGPSIAMDDTHPEIPPR